MPKDDSAALTAVSAEDLDLLEQSCVLEPGPAASMMVQMLYSKMESLRLRGAGLTPFQEGLLSCAEEVWAGLPVSTDGAALVLLKEARQFVRDAEGSEESDVHSGARDLVDRIDNVLARGQFAASETKRCSKCGGFGYARAGSCWTCDGTGVETSRAPIPDAPAEPGQGGEKVPGWANREDPEVDEQGWRRRRPAPEASPAGLSAELRDLGHRLARGEVIGGTPYAQRMAAALAPPAAATPAAAGESGELRAPHVFLDCDGVLADFDAYALEYFGKPPRQAEAELGTKEFWRMLEAKGDFYLSLPLMPDAMALYEAVKHLSPTILTGCPRGTWAQGQKVEWAAKHFPGVPIITCRSADKRDYARPGDVLIDDWPQHRHRWIEMGGVFITHMDARSSVEALWAHYPALRASDKPGEA